MFFALQGKRFVALCALFCACSPARPQAPLNATGQIAVDGRSTPYLIRHLPVSAFPQLPTAIESALTERGCLIPQTYQAHHPENVIQASFERHGSSDWAVLCSVHGTVSLLVFFGGNPAKLSVLASAPETERLASQPANGVLGFNWGIDPASPEQVHEAQLNMRRRPPRIDHDAVADTIIDQVTVFHYYSVSNWTFLDTQD